MRDRNRCTLPVVVGFLLSAAAAATAQPANDDFANRVTLIGAPTSDTGTNVNATQELGEPNPAGVSGTRSVWWTWTAPASGAAVVDTVGSGYDTTLGVYTGSVVSGLTLVGENDDTFGLQSQVTFPATAGTVYQILINGFSGSSGPINVNVDLTSPPANDDFANRIPLGGTSVSTNGSNIFATAEAGEPDPAGISGPHSVWWAYTPPESGIVTVDTVGSDYDTSLGVYRGTAVNALTLVGDNDDTFGLQSEVVFGSQAIENQIQVNGFGGDSGSITLTISLVTTTQGFDQLISDVNGLVSTGDLSARYGSLLTRRLQVGQSRLGVPDNEYSRSCLLLFQRYVTTLESRGLLPTSDANAMMAYSDLLLDSL